MRTDYIDSLPPELPLLQVVRVHRPPSSFHDPPTRKMPVPDHVFKQIKRIIPPLNGKLHKGQSGKLVARLDNLSSL